MGLQVILSDDHQLVREGLKLLLERRGISVIGEAANGQEAIRLAQKFQPQVAVLDVAMPLLNGLDAAQEIHRISPKTKVVLLTMYTETQYILEAFHIGVKAFVRKTHAPEDLVRAVQEAAQGRAYLSPELGETLLEAYKGKIEANVEPLSLREREVVQLIAEGMTTKKIAQMLHISIKTVETHRARIMDKLNIHETAGLVRYAIRTGLIQA